MAGQHVHPVSAISLLFVRLLCSGDTVLRMQQVAIKGLVHSQLALSLFTTLRWLAMSQRRRRLSTDYSVSIVHSASTDHPLCPVAHRQAHVAYCRPDLVPMLIHITDAHLWVQRRLRVPRTHCTLYTDALTERSPAFSQSLRGWCLSLRLPWPARALDCRLPLYPACHLSFVLWYDSLTLTTPVAPRG